jgi:DnaJ-class molecular chaperone
MGRGDFIVEVNIQVPKKLSKEQKELFEKLAATFGDPVKHSGFFHKIFD